MSAPSLTNSHVESAYARWAPIYDTVFTLTLRPGRMAAAEAINRLSGRVLDVGVGTGLELPMFGPQVQVTGIDLSEPMLRVAQKRVEERKLTNVEGLLVMDAMTLAFPDASFDAAVAPYVLTVVPEPERTLDEMARVVKPGGEIILVNHVATESGPIAWIEAWLAKRSDKLGWRPTFPWSILGDWIDRRTDLELIERRALAPLGLFTLVRLKRH
jgi:phosphatidylethanolamine/phosphatidyl-N-methylethanolamine N-methyltransferase